MALQPQIGMVVERLTELTRQNKMTWETTADEDTFLTSAGKYVVTIACGRDTGEDAGYRIRLLNDAGQVVEEAGAPLSDRRESGQLLSLSRSVEHQQLRSLHELARRSALHADEAVADLLTSLEQIR